MYKTLGVQFELAAFPEEDEALEGYFRLVPATAGDCVFDIGAHCGVSTYAFSKLVGPRGRVDRLRAGSPEIAPYCCGISSGMD